jgi:uncharacterized metal-binding protein YceD (DUF177 family)
VSGAWPPIVRLGELSRGPVTLTVEPDEAARAEIAKSVDLVALPALRAELSVRPWRDGAEIVGRFEARVVQICGVSLEEFEQPLSGEVAVAVAPKGSPNALEPTGEEIELDPEAPEPPDVLSGDSIDVGAYLVEHLALEIDPFPRKPGVVFDYEPSTPEEGPFAALKKLKDQS